MDKEYEKELYQKQLENESKRRLLKIVEQKIRTTMIGAICAIEEKWGFLWNDGNPQNEEQKEYFMEFQDIRTQILDNGNKQIRNITDEISNYVIRTNFKLSMRKNQNG